MSTVSAASRAQAIEALKQFIKASDPGSQPDILLAEDTKFGLIDSFFFDKIKPDKNGVCSSTKLIKQSFNSMKELVMALKGNPHMLQSVATIAYKPINDNYHFIIVRKLSLSKENIEKYLLLM